MKVVLIGAGNVGTQMGIRLREVGADIQQVFSRKHQRAKELGTQLHCPWTNQLAEITTEAQLYILAIKDDASIEVAEQLSNILAAFNPLVVHTSGATPGQQLRPFFKRYGVFYPLQTISQSRKADFSQIPICYHANRKGDRQKLDKLAQKLSSLVYQVDDAQRAALHVAAVFVKNFTNHLYHIGQQIVEQEQLPFELLKPLILETALKIQQHQPADMQTGPAVRADQKTIQRHLNFLEKYPSYQEIYRILTKRILGK